MPDIDIDFDERRRGDMIRYATEKYGEERVSQIITYGTIKAKAAVKDAARVLGYPYALGDRITKAMPPAVMGKDIPLAGIFDTEARAATPRPRSSARSTTPTRTSSGSSTPPRARGPQAAVGRARRRRHPVARAAARRHPDPAPRAGRRDHHPVRHGRLRGARPAQDGLPRPAQPHRPRRLPRAHQEQPRRERRPRGPRSTDPATYELLCRGDTLGVFQLEGGPMRALLRSMQPRRFEDISAVIALYRPGPMGDGQPQRLRRPQERPQADEPDPPRARRAAGRDPRRDLRPDRLPGAGHGDRAEGRRLLARPGRPAPPRDGQEEEGDPRQGVRPVQRRHAAPTATATAAIETLWDTLVPFSDYAFNKAHTAGYGLVSYWTAYLKANYPAEYMAALLTSVRDDKDKSALYLDECRRMGIKVLPPDVNDSDADFTPVGTDIRFGLAAIRNVGDQRRRLDRRDPQSQGRVRRLRRLPGARSTPVVCNKKVIESLIKAGAFDSLGHTRRGLSRSTPRRSTPASTPSGPRRSGSSTSSAATSDEPAPALRRSELHDPGRPSGTRRSCSPSSARCSASTSPTTRCSGSSTSSRRRSTARSSALSGEDRADGSIVTVAGILSRWPAR